MKTALLAVLLALSVLTAAILQAHHGPGLRGYGSSQTHVISGVITECFDCKNPESHGFLDIKVNSVNWEVTLPFRVPKASLQKLTPGTAVKVTGIPHDRKAHNLYAREIIVNGINLPLAGSATAR